MEINLTCAKCKGLNFEITTDEPGKIHIEDLDCLIGEYYTFTFHCAKCSEKYAFSVGSD